MNLLLPVLLIGIGGGIAQASSGTASHSCTLTITSFLTNGDAREQEFHFTAKEMSEPKIDGLFSRKIAKKTVGRVEAIGLFYNDQVVSAELIHRSSGISTIQAVGDAEPVDGSIAVQTNLNYPQGNISSRSSFGGSTPNGFDSGNASETALLRCETKEGEK